MKRLISSVTCVLAVFCLLSLSSCASSSGSQTDPFAGRAYTQTYEAITYNFEFNDDRTFTIDSISQGALQSRETYSYSYDASKNQMTRQLKAVWLPEDPVEMLTASTAEDYNSIARIPMNKARYITYCSDITDVIEEYYAAIGTPLSAEDKKDTFNALKDMANYMFDVKTLYDVTDYGDALSLRTHFTDVKNKGLSFFTPQGTSNDHVTGVFFCTGQLFNIIIDGESFQAMVSNGNTPVLNTSKKTLTVPLIYEDEYNLGTLVCSYTMLGSGNDSVLRLTITKAPDSVKAIEGTVADLVFYPEGFDLVRTK